MICIMFIKILKITTQTKKLIVYDDVIADMINNKKLNPLVTELFIRGRKLNISIVLLLNHILKCHKMLD